MFGFHQEIDRLILFFMTLGATHALALPSCPSDQNATFDNCLGTYDWTSGENKVGKYIGEWKGGLKHGPGIYLYLADKILKVTHTLGNIKITKNMVRERIFGKMVLSTQVIS